MLQIESLDKELTRVRKTVKSLESKLLNPDLPLKFRKSMAIHISGAAIEAAQCTGEEVLEALKTGRRVIGEVEEKTSVGTDAGDQGVEEELRRPMPARAVADAPTPYKPLRTRRELWRIGGETATMATAQEHHTWYV